MDTIYASFEDAVIRGSDLQLLSSPFWLNDALVGFYFEYLAKHVYKTSDSVCFMHPATACLISSFSNEDALVIKQVLHPLDLSKFELIFIPVSDGTGEYAGSGTHWSLLLYSSRQMQWQHYDSSRSANAKPSRNLARIIDAIFDNRQCNSQSLSILDWKPSFKDENKCLSKS
eukprot:TRINITY_DN3479_c0_g1_i1.p1 TRINITY_DN3479_c0_g1~~TRINITY_DN3479_c0_g1_i1.p1  ORF type:complete len:172 (-),score=31.53 TRINITY_DN3479_c0_g1_i1:918-1433(-)